MARTASLPSSSGPLRGSRSSTSSARGHGRISRRVSRTNTSSFVDNLIDFAERQPSTNQPAASRGCPRRVARHKTQLPTSLALAPAENSSDEHMKDVVPEEVDDDALFNGWSRRSKESFDPAQRPIRIDKWGDPDRANGPSYAIREGNAPNGKIIGDMREKMDYLPDDNERINDFNVLYRGLHAFAKEYFNFHLVGPEVKRQHLLHLGKNLSDEFVRIAGFVAVGGPWRIHGWEELFLRDDLRVALVIGVIWKVLKEHCFAHLMFGGSEEQIKELEDAEQVFRKTKMGIDGGFDPLPSGYGDVKGTLTG
jgi:hypothetical protein